MSLPLGLNPSSAQKSTHSTLDNTNPKHKKPHSCPICLDEYPLATMRTVRRCKHSFCPECLREYLTARISTSKVLMIPCPQSGCKQILSTSIIKRTLDPETYQRFRKIAHRKVTLRTTRHKFCPKPGCSRPLKLSTRKEYTVCGCGTQICNTCTSFRHEGKSCLEAIDPEFELYSKDNRIRFCIVCKTPGNKELGCSEIRCPVCEFEWCWTCGRQYVTPHFCCCYWSPVSPKEWKYSSCTGKIWYIITGLLGFPFKLFGCLLLWPFFDCFESDFSSVLKKPIKSFCLILFSIMIGVILLPLSLPLMLCGGMCVKLSDLFGSNDHPPKPWMTGNVEQFRYPYRIASVNVKANQAPEIEGRQIVESQVEKKNEINIEQKTDNKSKHVAIEIVQDKHIPSEALDTEPSLKIKVLPKSEYFFLSSKTKGDLDQNTKTHIDLSSQDTEQEKYIKS